MYGFVDSLRRKHHIIESKIEAELRKLLPDAIRLQWLKKSRLAIEDRLFQLRRARTT